MATSSAGDLRNFAIVGHASSGKTMLSEAMLACAGVIGRMGSIAQGTTVSDYHVSERQRQISTQTSLLHCEWMGKKLNIIDTPGYLDFISEALARVARGGLRARGGARATRHRRGHGAGVELRDGLRHPEGHRRQRGGQTERALRRSAGRRARALRAEGFSAECADQSRAGLQPSARRVAQRSRDL